MLSGTNSWRTDRHSLPFSAFCKGSCNRNEQQSGLFGTLLIFDANIWGKQALRRTARYDNLNFSHSLCDLTAWWISTAKPIFVLISKIISIALSLCLSWPLCILFLFASIFVIVTLLSLSLFSYLCSTESNSDWPSPTGLCWCPALCRWSVSPSSSTLSLSPSVPYTPPHTPLSLPFGLSHH